jgi:fibronectin-binding autotransporter adhesin
MNAYQRRRQAISRAPRASTMALAISLLFPIAAYSAEYLVNDDASFVSAVNAINTNGDTNAVIKLSGDITLTTALTLPSTVVQIDTQGHVLNRNGNVIFSAANPSQYVLDGNYTATGATAAVQFNAGVATASAISLSTMIINGNVTGGTGVGVMMALGAKTLINRGNIKGGQGNNTGHGVSINGSNTLINEGVIEGGDVTGGIAGAGVTAGALPRYTIINSGVIRGGSDLNGGAGGGVGVHLMNGGVNLAFIENTGTIEGGLGAAAITASNGQISLINSGTINAGADAGAGRPNAITWSGGAALFLELRAGSKIDGNVVAGAGASDVLKFGGSANATFDDAAQIGTQYQNFDSFVKTGSSIWTLNGTLNSTGPWSIEDGTLLAKGTINGDVTNAGTVGTNGLSTLTVNGNYISNNGTIRINSQLAGDGSSTGKLVVTGDTSGTGKIQVANLGGGGAKTTEGIKIVDVQGASNGAYTLLGNYTFEGDQAVVGGAYAYRLYQNGVATPADGDWYLRSALISSTPGGGTTVTALLAPTVPLYEAYSGILQNLNQLGSFSQRVGNRERLPSGDALEGAPGELIAGRGAWAHIDGENTHIDPASGTTGAGYKMKTWKFEAGIDMPLMESDAGTLVAGPTVHYGTADADVSSRFGDGSLDVRGYGIGGTLTWYGNNGVYVDGQAATSWYDTDIRSSTLNTAVANGNNGRGFSAGIETGRRLPLGDNWTVTPQVQLTWSKVRFDSFTDQFGADVSHDDGSSLVARLGFSLDRESKWTIGGKERRARVYGIANLYYDFLDGTSAHVADLDVESREQALWAGIGGGAFTSWDNDRYTVYGELLARTSLQDFGDSHAIGAKVGVRIKW